MKKIITLFTLIFLLAGSELSATVVTLTLNDHNGTEITTGVTWGYRIGYSGSYISITSGDDLPPNANNFRVTYGAAGQSTFKIQDITTDANVIFQTVGVNVTLEDCDGNTLAGTLGYRVGYSGAFQPVTGPLELLELTGYGSQGKYGFQVKYGPTSRYKISKLQDISVDPNILFTTTTVTMIGTAPIQYRIGFGQWQTYNGSLEMLPMTYKFRFGGSGAGNPIAVSGCSITGGFITLVDEAGNPMVNYSVDYPAENNNLKYKYRCGGSWAAWTKFHTDANGQIWFSIDCPNDNWDNKITMVLNQTSMEQDVTVNSTFQAAKVNVNLKTCDGLITDAPGGTVEQGGGYWFTHGMTGTTGTVSLYTFPTSSIKLRMNYNHGKQILYSAIVAGTNEVDFTTTAVTFNYANDIKSNKGGSWWMFNKPTMDLLPGDYKLWFKDGSSWNGPMELAVSGCTMDKSPLFMKLFDSNGDGLEGGIARYRIGSDPYQIAGTTDANGEVFALIDGNHSSLWFKMEWLEHNKAIKQNISTNSTVVFQTKLVTVKLDNSSNAPLIADELFYRLGGGAYVSLGTNISSATVEMLPMKVWYKTRYLGHNKFMKQNVGSNSTVTFKTKLVTVKLDDSNNQPLIADELFYRHGGGSYVSLGTNISSATVEMLPMKVWYKTRYLGHDKNMKQNVGSNSTVTFKTVAVTMQLLDASSNPLAGSAFYRNGAGSYVAFGGGTTTTMMEMLPMQYWFKCSYNTSTKNKKHTVKTSKPIVTFIYNGTTITRKAQVIIPVVEESSFKTYPNPTSQSAKFEFASPEDTHVRIVIYDMTGRMVKTVFDNPIMGGVNYKVEFVPESQISGMYIYRMTIGEKVYNGKIVYKK